ncbi:MAG: hypothetical protein HJJLKODD_00417 [Phycisphaerae bacterium]|nr:hypothetical protein [Phycisphaerae bacterium]
MNALRFLNAADRQAVEQAIAESEKQSAVQIVCAVATESGRYDRAEAFIGFLCALVGLVLVNIFYTELVQVDQQWGSTPAPLIWQFMAVAGGFVAGQLAASYLHPLRRLLVSHAEMEAEVARAGALVFHQQRLANTPLRGGVLIYVSLFERRVLILADQAAMAVLDQAGVEALRDLAVERLRRRQYRATLVDVVQEVGQRLCGAFENAGAIEAAALPNELLLVHPRP